MERSPEFRQLLIGISTMRYFPPSGTAGFARSFVNGNKRVPAPPPMMTARVRCVVPGGSAGVEIAAAEERGSVRLPLRTSFCVCTCSITQGLRLGATFLLIGLFARSCRQWQPSLLNMCGIVGYVGRSEAAP